MTNDVPQICDDLVALHSSDPATVYLSALARMATPAIDAVDQALYDDRSVVRYHAMRRTLWVMTPPVARLADAAATAKVARAERKRTLAALADSTDIVDAKQWFDDATDEVIALLEEQGPLSTRSIGQALPHLVRPVRFGAKTKHPASINAHTKVLQGAGFSGLLMRCQPATHPAWQSSEYVWASAASWLDHPIVGADEHESAAALLDRWLRRFGPATSTDIRWWFGWTAALAKRALQDAAAIPVALNDGCPAFVAASDAGDVDDPGPWVRLLPGLDPTSMGWKERDWYLDPGLVPTLFDRFGNAGPVVWVDGRIVGAWAQRPDGKIVVDPAIEFGPLHQPLLNQAVDQLQAAIGDAVVRPRFPTPAQKHLAAG